MELINRLTAVVFPNRCFVCDKVLPFPGDLCENCRKNKIDYGSIKGAVCDICGLKLNDCNCAPSRYYVKAVFPFLYDGDVRSSLHRLKFRGRLDKVKPFANAMYDALKQREINDVDIITFIPMSERSENQRGYNQAKLLCDEISGLSEINSSGLLYKTGGNRKQHDLNMIARKGNILGIYEPKEEYIPLIKGKTILIVDDILTTGSTLNEAAKTLLIFGAENVYVAAAAARPKKR